MAEQMIKPFEKDDLVLFEQKIWSVADIVNTHLGYRTFLIVNLVTGEERCVAKHQIEHFIVPVLQEGLSLEEFLASTTDDKPVTAASATRHVDVNEADMVEVANQRLSEKTVSQTKWAVNLFRGM